MKYRLQILLLFVIISFDVNAQDSVWVRKYQFGVFNQYDLRNSSTNGISTHRVLCDIYRKGVKPKMSEGMGNITYGVYSFMATYVTMLWSHEFGHSLRAKQVGGYFNIHNVALPIPYTTMHLPSDINLVDESLSVTAGFEVNYLNVRGIQEDFIRNNGTYNEDLSFAFANRLMYPLYTSLIIPINPKDKDVWINTAGDPVHVTLPVFKNYSNNQVFLSDSSVNPELVKFYNQSAMFGSLFNLLDPQFYKEVGASFGKDKSRKPLFVIGDYNNGWTYGTLFNVSPLGYELYLNNYIHINDNKFSLYAKYGNPFRNNGIGVSWIESIPKTNMNFVAKIEAWDQDIFDKGVSGEVMVDYKFMEKLGMSLNAGYKTRGYVLGKQIDEGFNCGVGLIYYAKY